MNEERRITMYRNDEPGRKEILVAAELALKTGNVQEIIPLVPEGYENTIKNLFEKTLCAQRLGSDNSSAAVNWYYISVLQLCAAGSRKKFPL